MFKVHAVLMGNEVKVVPLEAGRISLLYGDVLAYYTNSRTDRGRVHKAQQWRPSSAVF